MTPFDSTLCTLGEGTLWHPLRGELFWFDILGAVLYRRGQETVATPMAEMCSAAAWVDYDHLLIASQSRLMLHDIDKAQSQTLALLEPERAETRSNDGRADPFGGFWVGTMEMSGQAGQGTLYRYYRGELRPLRSGLGIPNGICFAPDASRAYFADTAQGLMWQWRLGADGWPEGEPELFIDFNKLGLNPDGAVTDAEGTLWVAHWGGGCIGRYSAEGAALGQIALPASQPTCPAFGGPDLTTLYCSSAKVDLASPSPLCGATFALPNAGQGRPEPAVTLSPAVIL